MRRPGASLLAICSSTGVIYGDVSFDEEQEGPYSVTVTAFDVQANVSASKTFSWAVDSPSAQIGPEFPNIVPPWVPLERRAGESLENWHRRELDRAIGAATLRERAITGLNSNINAGVNLLGLIMEDDPTGFQFLFDPEFIENLNTLSQRIRERQVFQGQLRILEDYIIELQRYLQVVNPIV